MPLEWKLGYQKLDWGNRFIVLGGLRDLNPIDIPALTRPGMLQREQETRIPVPQIFARLGSPQSTSVEGFYQFHFERNAPNHCGTFYSGVDWFSDGCNAVMVGNTSDRTALATGSFLKRADNVMPSDSGQFGAALSHTVESWATKFGLYATQFHSRTGYSGVIKSTAHGWAALRAGRPGRHESEVLHRVPRGHQDVRPELRNQDEGRHGIWRADLPAEPAASVQRFRPSRGRGIAHCSDDAARRGTRAAAGRHPPGLRAAQECAIAAGGHRAGAPRARSGGAQLGRGSHLQGRSGPSGPLGDALRAGGRVRAGAGERRVPAAGRAELNAPRTATSRAMRSATAWWPGCAMPMSPTAWTWFPLSSSGTTSRAGPATAAILEGRKLAVASLRANWRSGFTADIAWVPTWGGTYNNQRDRSAVLMYIGQRF